MLPTILVAFCVKTNFICLDKVFIFYFNSFCSSKKLLKLS